MLPYSSSSLWQDGSPDSLRHRRSSSAGSSSNHLDLAARSRPHTIATNPFLASPSSSSTQPVGLARPRTMQRQRSNSLPHNFNYAYSPQVVYLDKMVKEPASMDRWSPASPAIASSVNRQHLSIQGDPFRPSPQRRRSQSLTSLAPPSSAPKWDWSGPSLETASSSSSLTASPASTERFHRRARQSLSSLNSPKHIIYDPDNLHSDEALFEMALHTSMPELDSIRKELGIKRGQRPKMPSHAHPRLRSHCKPLILRFEQLMLLEATQMKMQQTITARNTAVNAANATGLPVKLPVGISIQRDARHATPLRPLEQPAAAFEHFNKMHQSTAQVTIPGQRYSGLGVR